MGYNISVKKTIMSNEKSIPINRGGLRQTVNADEQLQTQMFRLETRLLMFPTDTFKPLSRIASDLGFNSERGLIEYLSNKNVLDLGSGFNGLSVGCILKNVTTDITSVTPRKNDPNFKIHVERLLNLEKEYDTYSQEKKGKVIQQSLEKTRAAFAHDLSSFDDGSFDVIIDDTAVFHFARENESLIFKKSLREELRILRKNGTIRIGDYTFKALSWKEKVLKEEGINYRVIPLSDTSVVEITKK